MSIMSLVQPITTQQKAYCFKRDGNSLRTQFEIKPGENVEFDLTSLGTATNTSLFMLR